MNSAPLTVKNLLLFGISCFFLMCSPCFAADTEELPAPANKPTACPALQWPREARRYELEGKVEMSVLVGEDGRVLDTRLRKSSGWKILDEATIAGQTKCAFQPLLRDGKPVRYWAKVNFVWRLEDDGQPTSTPGLIENSCAPSSLFRIADNQGSGPVLRLRLLLDREGRPFGIKIEDGSKDMAIDRAAIDFVASCRYASKTIDGKPARDNAVILLALDKKSDNAGNAGNEAGQPARN